MPSVMAAAGATGIGKAHAGTAKDSGRLGAGV